MMNRGFTLIEVMVAVTIFSVVMTVALGSLLAMSESNRRAEALKSVINNLNFSLENMSRSIRTGYNYHCGTGGDLALPSPQDCTGAGASYFAYRSADGFNIAYCLDGTAIKRQIVAGGVALSGSCNSSNFVPITSSEVLVEALQFVVIGAQDIAIQPKTTILLSGSVRLQGAQTSRFDLQTSVTQRLYDQ